MKKIINISVIALILTFLCFVFFGYTKLSEVSTLKVNEIEKAFERLYEVISSLSYGIVALISVIILLLIKKKSSLNKNIPASIIEKVNLGKEEVAEEKEISITERIGPVIKQFTENLKKISSITPSEKWNNILKLITQTVEADVSILYKFEAEKLIAIASYAHIFENEEDRFFSKTEGLIGQVVKSLKPLNITNIPKGYINIVTGLGESSPENILILPIINKNKLTGIIELAALKQFSELEEQLLEKLCLLIAKEIEN